MARHLSAGGIVGITPDGPKGPAREVQAGTPRLAVETGATIVPVAVGARRCWFAPSWDRFLFPHPFAQVSFHWGEPIPVRKDGGPDEVERVSRLLKQALDEVTAEADRAWGRTNAPWRRAGKGAGAS
jgi:lysophospholipid acyltransferase (LPLAT)-like uncharacterized protein